MLPELKALEDKLGRDYREKQHAAVEVQWAGLDDDEKPGIDPGRFLGERFPGKKSKEKNVVMVKLSNRHEFQELAGKMGLFSMYREIPRGSENGPYLSRYVAVGRSKDAVYAYFKNMDRESGLKRKREEEVEEKETRKRHQQVVKQSGKWKDWDVTGKWKIECDAFESDDDLTLNIYLDKSNGTQMYGKFDFGMVTGVLRFEKQASDSGCSAKKQKVKYGYEDMNEEDGEDEWSGRRSPTAESFYLDSALPSSKHPTWTYRWRGEETGEGEIQLGSDNEVFQIAFGGPKGTELEGTFGACFTGNCRFTGRKVGLGTASSIDIGYEWVKRNADAYERARVGR